MKRPILYLVTLFSVGIISSHLLEIPLLYPLLLSASFVILTFLLSKDKLLSHINLYLAVFFFSMAYYQNSNLLAQNHISNFTSRDSKKIFLKGTIVDDPVISTTFYKREKTSFILNANYYKEDSRWHKVAGLLKVDMQSTPQDKLFFFGDEVILEGFISKIDGLANPGLFNYSKYLAMKDIYSILKVKEGMLAEKVGNYHASFIKWSAYKLRHKIRGLIDRYFDEPQSGFLKAILIGDRASLDSAINDDFIKTGTVHVLAISGLNVVMIAGIFLAFFSILRIPKRVSLVLTLAFLVFYSFAAGSSPPIIRATIAFAIFVIGYLISRDSDALNALSIAALLILLWNPKELFDPSFQLSFMSILSIIIFSPKVNGLLGINKTRIDSTAGKIKQYILKGVSVSIAAWLGTWLLIASYFNIISPISIIANLAVIPILFIVTAASFLFFLAAIIPNFFTLLFAQGISLIEGLLFTLNRYFAMLPLSHFRIGAPSIGYSILYYAFISLTLMPAQIEFKRLKIHGREILIIILVFFNILIWKDVISANSGVLKITFLDIGQGDSAFIEFPNKGNLLIDGGIGGEKDRFDAGKSVIAPFLWNNGIFRIDAILITHFHEDHLGGIIYILNNFDVGCVIDNGAVVRNNRFFDEYKRIVKNKRLRHIVVGEGDEIEGFDEIKIFILNPEKDKRIVDSNENSIVSKLLYKNFSVIFCGDVMEESMERLNSYGAFLKSDVIKVPHHGGRLGKEGIVRNFFHNVSSQFCIISVGKMDDYNMPSKNTLNILSSLKSMNYETKNDGAVTMWIGPSSGVERITTVRKN